MKLGDIRKITLVDEFGDPVPLQDLLPSSENVESKILKKVWQEVVQKEIAKLPLREYLVIKLRLGIGTEEPRTLESIGQEFGVTRERIRQIEKKALRKLAHNEVLRELYRDKP